MKIAILTFWSSNDNYGQLLQCYALQKYLKDLGHEVFLIKYHAKSSLKKTIPLYIRIRNNLNPIYFFRKYFRKHKNQKIHNEELKFNRQFDSFRSKYITFSKDYFYFKDLINDPPKADAYIVGSDQVWNDELIKFTNSNSYPAYFLDFGNKDIKRLGYAVSFGKEKLSDSYIKYLKTALRKFDFISVREKNGIELCKECGIDNAEFVCDPTLLLSAETYRSIYKENPIPEKQNKFLFLYILNNNINFDISKVYKFAASKNLDIVYVTGNGLINIKNRTFATIPEWLYFVDNAEYVITNSYHCGIFCTIFQKKFGIIALAGKQQEMNQRFNTLFELRETGDRYITDNDFSILDKPYNSKDINISSQFLSFLRN